MIWRGAPLVGLLALSANSSLAADLCPGLPSIETIEVSGLRSPSDAEKACLMSLINAMVELESLRDTATQVEERLRTESASDNGSIVDKWHLEDENRKKLEAQMDALAADALRRAEVYYGVTPEHTRGKLTSGTLKGMDSLPWGPEFTRDEEVWSKVEHQGREIYYGARFEEEQDGRPLQGSFAGVLDNGRVLVHWKTFSKAFDTKNPGILAANIYHEGVHYARGLSETWRTYAEEEVVAYGKERVLASHFGLTEWQAAELLLEQEKHQGRVNLDRYAARARKAREDGAFWRADYWAAESIRAFRLPTNELTEEEIEKRRQGFWAHQEALDRVKRQRDALRERYQARRREERLRLEESLRRGEEERRSARQDVASVLAVFDRVCREPDGPGDFWSEMAAMNRYVGKYAELKILTGTIARHTRPTRAESCRWSLLDAWLAFSKDGRPIGIETLRGIAGTYSSPPPPRTSRGRSVAEDVAVVSGMFDRICANSELPADFSGEMAVLNGYSGRRPVLWSYVGMMARRAGGDRLYRCRWSLIDAWLDSAEAGRRMAVEEIRRGARAFAEPPPPNYTPPSQEPVPPQTPDYNRCIHGNCADLPRGISIP